jgi:hypothetical protein
MAVIINGTTGLSGVSTVNLANGSVTQNILANGVAATGPAFSAYADVDQSVTNNVYTKVTLGTEEFDTNNCFASSRFTPTVAGYYQINGNIRAGSATASLTLGVSAIYKNGVIAETNAIVLPTGVTSVFTNISSLIYLNGSTDYIELYAYITGTSPFLDFSSTVSTSRFSASLARAA